MTQKLVVTTTQVVIRIIGFLQESRYKGTQNARPEITALGTCKKSGKLLQMNHHALLDICDCVALFFVHMNSVVLPSDSQRSDDPAFHDLLATEFSAGSSFEQFP